MLTYERVKKILFDPNYRFIGKAVRGRYNYLSDEEYIKRMFKAKMGYEPNLINPHTFNEKLQWLKLHDRKPIYTNMVDKYEAKGIIAERIGEEYVVPTLGVWEQVEDIDFGKLPNQFVLKTTHDSGGVILCSDKKSFDITKARMQLRKSLKKNYYYYGREWPYKDIKPRVIAEKLLQSAKGNETKDYKLHCLNGQVKFLYVTSDRFNGKGLKADYFDENFNKLDIQWELPNSEYTIIKPENFELMKELACRLAEDIIVLRVDFYEIDGKLYVGELTFFDGSGFAKINGDWDEVLGKMVKLPVD